MFISSHCNHPSIVNQYRFAINCTLPVASMLAPFPINIRAISTWPFFTAPSNGVNPSCACTKVVKYTACNQISQNKQTSLSCIPFNLQQAAQAIPSQWRDIFHASLHVHSNVATSSNVIDSVLCGHHTNLTFQQCNNSHIQHLHMSLFNPNVHNMCIHARKLFSVSNWDNECPILCTAPLQMHFMHSKKFLFVLLAFQFSSWAFIRQSP